MLLINTIPLSKEEDNVTYWAKFELNNERISCRFIKDGTPFHSVYNITYPYGTIGMVIYLNNNRNAQREITKIIERENKLDHEELKGLSVYHSEYHTD